jgi:hypothetical protein
MIAPKELREKVTPEVLKAYEATFIKVHAFGKFHPDDLDRNNMSSGPLPDLKILNEFMEKLNGIPSTQIVSAFDQFFCVCY